jgi:hypothetical protein
MKDNRSGGGIERGTGCTTYKSGFKKKKISVFAVPPWTSLFNLLPLSQNKPKEGTVVTQISLFLLCKNEGLILPCLLVLFKSNLNYRDLCRIS